MFLRRVCVGLFTTRFLSLSLVFFKCVFLPTNERLRPLAARRHHLLRAQICVCVCSHMCVCVLYVCVCAQVCLCGHVRACVCVISGVCDQVCMCVVGYVCVVRYLCVGVGSSMCVRVVRYLCVRVLSYACVRVLKYALLQSNSQRGNRVSLSRNYSLYQFPLLLI